MKKTMRMLLAASLLALLTALPAMSLALQTALPVELGDTLPPFGRSRDALGVSASDKSLYQARVADFSLNLRVTNKDGEPFLFTEDLSCLDRQAKALRLSLSVPGMEEGATLQIDQHAVDLLKRVGVAQIVVADGERIVQARYLLGDIDALRKGLALRDGEQLCLSGEDSPVTVITEDGIRRQVAF